MQTSKTRTPNRAATPARWQTAARRAVADQVRVLQLAGCGQWIATSGSDSSTAYELDVTGAVAHGCTCLAGLNGDPVCKHRAAFYLSIGALSLDPEPGASRSGRHVACSVCGGQGSVPGPGRSRATCSACNGRGRFVRQAAA